MRKKFEFYENFQQFIQWKKIYFIIKIFHGKLQVDYCSFNMNCGHFFHEKNSIGFLISDKLDFILSVILVLLLYFQ